MKFNVITLMPDLIRQGLDFGVVGASFSKNINELCLINPREFTEDRHQTVDDRPFGGGDGMLMMAEPLQRTLDSLEVDQDIYFLSPQGQRWTDAMAKDFSKKSQVTLICGRYGGVDQRFLNQNKIHEISIGDYVLSGGELGALVVIDSVCRHIPQVLGHNASATEDSFKDDLLEAPHFTRPQHWQNQGVPEILLSGDHKKIAAYKNQLRWIVTLMKRPDLIVAQKLPVDEIKKAINRWPLEDWDSIGLDKDDVLKRLEEL